MKFAARPRFKQLATEQIMPSITIACPACGARRIVTESELGQRLHCGCGMMFSASPVFAVPEERGPSAWFEKFSAMSKAGKAWLAGLVFGAIAFGVAGGFAIWWLNQPTHKTEANDSVGEFANSGTPAPVTPAATAPSPSPAVEVPKPPPTPPVATVPAEPVPEPVKPVPTTPPTPTPPPPPTPVATLSAVTLWDAFDLNPEDAANRYVGKVVEVTARGKLGVDTLGKEYFGAEVVKPMARPGRRLTPDEQRWEKEGYPPNVRCYLAPGQSAALESLPPGRPIVFRGTVVGRKDQQNVYRGYTVELQDCMIVTDGK